MWSYLLRRVLLLVPVLFGVTLLTFVISHVLPADPVSIIAGPKATEEQIQRIRERWGLDQPIYKQYAIYLSRVLRGDLGESIYTRRPVIEDIKEFFPATAELTVFALVVAGVFGVGFGVISAVKRNTFIDHCVRVLSLTWISMPVFWLGLLMLFVFYYKLGALPSGGRLDPTISVPGPITGLYILDSVLTLNLPALISSLKHLILLGFTLGLVLMGTITRITRASMLDVLTCDYVKTARAKGLRETMVLLKHALRNALIPVVTIAGILLGQSLGGAVLTETVFSWPGMGLYITKAITFLDFEPIMGFTLIFALTFAVLNICVDFVYAFLDPRIRYT